MEDAAIHESTRRVLACGVDCFLDIEISYFSVRARDNSLATTSYFIDADTAYCEECVAEFLDNLFIFNLAGST